MLAEGWKGPDRRRTFSTRCIGRRVLLGRARPVLAAGTLAGALIFSTCVVAQESSGAIAQRIESTFDLVIGNSASLAIPLTRRALARRSAVDKGIEPLSYSDATAMAEFTPLASDTADAAPADSSTGDGEVARLPRPRPEEQGAAASKSGTPLDLVAGAPAPPTAAPAQVVAAAEPHAAPAADQPILPAAPASPTPELVASGACLTPDQVTDKDGDFKRNAAALSGSAFCIAEETFKERRREWRLETVKTSRPGPLWAVMHDDEDMSFDNAVAALKTYGGTLVAVDTGGKRNMSGVDPNRNFSADGIGCSKLGTDAAPLYTAFFRNLLSNEPIIALHNDTGERIPTGGLGHVSMDNIPKEMQAFAAAGSGGPLAGAHNVVLLASKVPISATAESRAEALSAKGINVMIERVGDGDCSLSNYALLTNHPDYVNVTVGHDGSEIQQKIIDVLMAGRTEAVATQ